ncbi:MAG: FkbM family methyltransferase [Pseudomonadota bacterium]
MTRLNLPFLRSLFIYLNPFALKRWRKFYRVLLSKGDLVFDVGAHVGNRTRAMWANGVRVVAIEPQEPFFTFLKQSCPPGVTVLGVAVGRENTQAELAVSSRHPTVSTVSTDFIRASKSSVGFEHVNWDKTQSVEVVTLDALIAEHGLPRYIKIDVEGGEAAVLSGLSHEVPLISVEFLPAMPELTVALVDQLTAMGHTNFNIVQGESGAFLWPEWRDGGAVKAWLAPQDHAATSGDLFARRG